MKKRSSLLNSSFCESFRIETRNVNLNSDTQAKIRANLQALSDRAPATSMIILNFIYKKNQLHGSLSMTGAGKKFSSSLVGKSPWGIYRLMENDIDSQLTTWKKNRFDFQIPIHLKQQEVV